MNQPTYRIAQALHARRAAVGLPKYGQHLTAASPGCMLVHAIEEAADLTEYLLAEVQRRKIVMETLNELSKEMHAELAIGWAYKIEKLYDLLGGKSAIEQYDEILGGGTVAQNATVAPDPRDESLRVATDALEQIADEPENCGCRPICQCRNPESRAIELEVKKEVAKAALAAIRGAR